MRIQWDLATFLICALYLVTINIPSVGTFLFRRKHVHHIVNDPYQARKDNITRDNLFAWLNLKNHINFKLWTRRNPKLAHDLKIGDVESIRRSNFDARRLTKIIVHGYAHSANEIYLEDWIVSLRDAYLHMADLNVVIIDYTFFALPAFYWTAAPDLAARQLTAMIQFLWETKHITLEGLHLLGFSWGAHIAGIAGYQMGGRIGRITGLDPAQPTFRLVDDNRRLDKNDALFVDIIHTNSGRAFMEGHLGLGIPLGHADYYPNSGRAQPGCPLKWTYAYEEIECDHARSVNFFAESIVSPVAFPSCRCENWDHYLKGECPCNPEDIVFMGEHSPHSARGKFYLFTRDKKPYGFGSQMNISLPDIDQYDPDFNNTGYHYHLRPFHTKQEPQLLNDIPTYNVYLQDTIVTLDPETFSQVIPNNNLPPLPPEQPQEQVYWEPISSYVIKSDPVDEHSYIDHISDSDNENRLNSNNLKRHSHSMNDSISTSDIIQPPRVENESQTTEKNILLIIKPKRKQFVSFSRQLIYKYVNNQSESSQPNVSR